MTYDVVVRDDPLAWALRGLLYALDEPESKWQEIEQAWVEASLAAAGTEHEGAVRASGVLLRLHDTDRLAEGLRELLARLQRVP